MLVFEYQNYFDIPATEPVEELETDELTTLDDQIQKCESVGAEVSRELEYLRERKRELQHREASAEVAHLFQLLDEFADLFSGVLVMQKFMEICESLQKLEQLDPHYFKNLSARMYADIDSNFYDFWLDAIGNRFQPDRPAADVIADWLSIKGDYSPFR